MKLVPVVCFLVCVALCAAGTAQAQSRKASSAAKAKPSIEGDWRVNIILPMESTPETPNLVVSEAEAKVIAASAGGALSDFFAKSLDPELPMLIPLSDGLATVRGQRRTRAVVQPADGRLPYTPAARK